MGREVVWTGWPRRREAGGLERARPPWIRPTAATLGAQHVHQDAATEGLVYPVGRVCGQLPFWASNINERGQRQPGGWASVWPRSGSARAANIFVVGTRGPSSPIRFGPGKWPPDCSDCCRLAPHVPDLAEVDHKRPKRTKSRPHPDASHAHFSGKGQPKRCTWHVFCCIGSGLGIFRLKWAETAGSAPSWGRGGWLKPILGPRICSF
mmetsp:Transcript_23520/g.42420  ORF Transcript_23520/g.42420 Transcript_23520/m.42420 type:complete len:208 (-) Transcript_23520:1019-1642(-)